MRSGLKLAELCTLMPLTKQLSSSSKNSKHSTCVPNAAMAVSMPSDSDADMSTAALQRCLGQVVLGCGLRVAADAEC